MTHTTAVLLAAGAGTRLGRGPKALLLFKGITLVEHATTALLAGGCDEVVVVVGAGAAQVMAVPLPPACRVVKNPHWSEGMGTSFAVGVGEAIAVRTDFAGAEQILVALVDQPGMDATLVSRLLKAHRPGRITAAGFRSLHGVAEEAGTLPTPNNRGTAIATGLRRGNPVVFARQHAVSAAESAVGDVGARTYLAGHPDAIDVVDCSDLTDGADIDTPAQLNLLHDAPHPAGAFLKSGPSVLERSQKAPRK